MDVLFQMRSSKILLYVLRIWRVLFHLLFGV